MFPIAECGLNVLPEVEWSIERAVGENPNFFIRCPILDQIEFVLRFQKNGCRGNPLKKTSCRLSNGDTIVEFLDPQPAWHGRHRVNCVGGGSSL